MRTDRRESEDWRAISLGERESPVPPPAPRFAVSLGYKLKAIYFTSTAGPVPEAGIRLQVPSALPSDSEVVTQFVREYTRDVIYLTSGEWRTIKVTFYDRATTRRRAFKLEIIAPYCARSTGLGTFINSSKNSAAPLLLPPIRIRPRGRERREERHLNK